MVQFGMNYNPRDPAGRPVDFKTTKGVQWGRIVFQAAAVHQSIDQAFPFYDALLNEFDAASIRMLLVLNQETFWGNGPWDSNSDRNWNTYAQGFAAACAQIAGHYRGREVAYEVWNEGDGLHGDSSVYVPPGDFAKVLNESSAAIRSADPKALIVFGGLMEAPAVAIQYVKDVRAALGGNLPVDAIGFHPYTKLPPNFTEKPTWGAWFGPLDADVQLWVDAFPTIPLWMTEFGVPADLPPGMTVPREQYAMIGKYLQGVYDLARKRFAKHVPVLVWFGWSDIMRNSGIVDHGNQPKGEVFTAFESVLKAAASSTALPHTTGVAGGSDVNISQGIILTPTTDGLSVRSGPGTSHQRLTFVNPSDSLVALDPPQDVAAKLGQEGQWLKVRAPDAKEGYTAAWFLKLAGIVLTATSGLNVRSGAGASFDKLDLVQPGDSLMALEPLADVAAKLGQQGQWIQIRTPSGKVGFAAAWFLEAKG